MKLRRLGVLLTALAILLPLSSCGEREPVPTGYPTSVGGVTFEQTPRRVVSLSPGVTESLYILGFGGRVVGVSGHCDRPSATAGLPRCGSPLEPDLEAIYSLRPDLVITGSQLTADATASLGEMGVAVVTMPYAEDIGAVLENQYDIIKIFTGELKAPALIEQVAFYADVRMSYTRDSVARFLRGEEEKPSAVYIAREDFVLATGDTLEGRFIEELGLINQAGPYSGWSYPPEEEPNLNPDIIFHGDEVSAQSLAENSYYARTKAVTGERVFAADGRGLERRSMMIFDELEQMARAAFPEAFNRPMPSLSPPFPEEPEVEPMWYDFILEWFK